MNVEDTDVFLLRIVAPAGGRTGIVPNFPPSRSSSPTSDRWPTRSPRNQPTTYEPVLIANESREEGEGDRSHRMTASMRPAAGREEVVTHELEGDGIEQGGSQNPGICEGGGDTCAIPSQPSLGKWGGVIEGGRTTTRGRNGNAMREGMRKEGRTWRGEDRKDHHDLKWVLICGQGRGREGQLGNPSCEQHCCRRNAYNFHLPHHALSSPCRVVLDGAPPLPPAAQTTTRTRGGRG